MGTASPALGLAVARAGALGMLSGVMLPPAELENLLTPIYAEPPGRFGVNFLIPFLEDPAVVDIAARNADVVEFFYGHPDPALVQRVHAGGALAAWQIGSEAEARAAVDAGCDFIIAQGVEAGGHVRGTTALLPLTNEVLQFCTVPIVAAGAIGDGRGIASALKAGTSAARLGTRFVATPESGYHPDYLRALVDAHPEDTVYTDKFSGTWPNAPHRVLRSYIEAAEAFRGEIVGQVQMGEQTIDVPRFSVMVPLASATGTISAMAHYAGQSVGVINSIRPAGELVAELMTEAESVLKAT